MLRLGFTILVLLSISCLQKDKTPGTISNDSILVKTDTNKDEIIKQTSECDSTKVADFKFNLSQIEIEFDSSLSNTIDLIARSFAKTECENDELFCDEITLRSKSYYKTDSNEYLFCYGYRFTDSKGMEEDAASFFVFGTFQDDYIFYYEIAADLIGEIKLFPTGLEAKNGTTVIWGKMYPYFSSDDYGKFRLEITRDYRAYEFQCKYQGH